MGDKYRIRIKGNGLDQVIKGADYLVMAVTKEPEGHIVAKSLSINGESFAAMLQSLFTDNPELAHIAGVVLTAGPPNKPQVVQGESSGLIMAKRRPIEVVR
jgi:hypothetical protein